MKTPLILLAVVLAGCAGPMAAGMNEGTSSLVGRHVSHAIEQLGMPDSELVVAGQHAYVWRTDYMGPQIYGDEDAQYVCQIRAFVDADDVVRGVDWKGNGYGCSEYVRRFQ